LNSFESFLLFLTFWAEVVIEKLKSKYFKTKFTSFSNCWSNHEFQWSWWNRMMKLECLTKYILLREKFSSCFSYNCKSSWWLWEPFGGLFLASDDCKNLSVIKFKNKVNVTKMMPRFTSLKRKFLFKVETYKQKLFLILEIKK